MCTGGERMIWDTVTSQRKGPEATGALMNLMNGK